MYLALLGFGMIVVFMALIMAKKLSPFTSLILIPILFGLLAGYGWDTLSYAMDGIKDVASTFAMMTFAILYFGIMLTAGMFDPMVDKVVSWCKGDPLKVLVGTAVLAAFVSLDGDGTTTVMICCTAMLPIYERLRIKKIYLATLIILQNCIMNLIPWGGPTARVMSVMQLDAGEILAPLVPGMVLGALYSVGVSYYLGLKERKRLGVTLPQEEAAAIALHFVNYQTEDTGKPAIDYGALIDEATAIVEQELHVEIDKDGFNYYRFVTHMHYLMKRTEEDRMIASQNLEVFTSLCQEFPEIYQCACKIAAKMQETLHQKLSDEEILYLMLHINRLCAREDCDQ